MPTATLCSLPPDARQGLKIHYRADNVDGAGNPGDALTTTLVNLANPGTHDGTIVNGSGVTANGGQGGTAFAYGVVLNDGNQTHIEASTYQVGGGVNKATDVTWEFWLRADSGITSGLGRGESGGRGQESGVERGRDD